MQEGERRAERTDTWVRAAWVLFAAGLALVLYLGGRPGGRAAILAFGPGRDALALCAMAVTVWGMIASMRARELGARRVKAFLLLSLVVLAAIHRMPYPSSYEGRPSAVRFELPARGEWQVLWGGERLQQNVLALQPGRRFGLDLVGVPGGEPARGRGVHAPAAGRVVAVRADLEDAGDGPGAARRRPAHPWGNHVVLEVAPGEFLVLGSLERGSVAAAPGDELENGAPLGRVGASALTPWTPEPHLAMHLQSDPRPGWGEGIPMRFRDYLADGVAVESGAPRGGLEARGEPAGQRIAPGSAHRSGTGPPDALQGSSGPVPGSAD
jgi:hypothetical protein